MDLQTPTISEPTGTGPIDPEGAGLSIDPVALAAELVEAYAEELEAWAARTAPEGHYFDERAAARAVAFFPRYLRHTKGRWYGQRFHLDPWQLPVIRLTFGWKRADGTRRFRIVYIAIPRKNGKTGLAAGVGCLLVYADGEPGAEVYSFANDKEQALIAWSTAAQMRAQEPELRNRSLIYKDRAIVVGGTGSAYKPLSSEFGNKDGLNTSGLIGDEIHAFKDDRLYNVLHTSTGARTQPLEFLITTAGQANTFCADLHDYAEKVRDGILDDPDFLPVIFGADPADDFTDPAVWARANPNLGRTISLDYMAKEAKRARALPRYENEFKRLHLNIWTEQLVRWLPMEAWEACSDAALDPERLAGRQCFSGLDLSSTRDLTALAHVFPWDADDPRLEGAGIDETAGDFGVDVACRFWLPADGIAEREQRDGVPYRKWAEQGWLELTPGNVADHDVIKRRILEDAERYRIAELPYDDWGGHKLMSELMAEGITPVNIRQGWKTLSPASKALERLVVTRRIDHGCNPVLRWNASNAVVETDAMENIKPTKDPKKARGRIDGILAVVMGLVRVLDNDDGADRLASELNAALARRGVGAL